MEKRITPGRYVPNGTFSELWKCGECGFCGGTGTWKAPDGEEGLWCYVCAEKGTKSKLAVVQVENQTWIRGLTEVKCCGQWLDCDRFTNTCDRCNRDYNHAGQLLWGEETGETASDILNGTW